MVWSVVGARKAALLAAVFLRCLLRVVPSLPSWAWHVTDSQQACSNADIEYS